jgi:citrate synthase
MTETNEPIKIHRGLKGVYFDRSPCTFIDGRIGELRYRGYSIHDLAEHSTFEETAWLLLNGELPTRAQLTEFDGALKAARELPAPIYEIIRIAKSGHPMDVLRTAVSALAVFDAETAYNSRDAVIRKGIRLTSQVPMIVAAHARLREGQEPVSANKELGHAANLLWMLKGEPRCRPTDRPRSRAARRAWFQRLILRCPRRDRHGSQPPRRDHRGNRGAVRSSAWRRRRGRDENGPRDRRSVPSGRLCAR